MVVTLYNSKERDMESSCGHSDELLVLSRTRRDVALKRKWVSVYKAFRGLMRFKRV